MALNKEVLEAINQNKYTLAGELLLTHAESADPQISIVQYQDLLHQACNSGQLEFIRLLVEIFHAKPRVEELSAAIQIKHLDIIKYLVIECGCEPITKHLDIAIKWRCFDIVKWLVIDGGCKPTTEHLRTAIQRGNLDIVEWLVVDGGCKPTTEHLDIAIRRMHSGIVKCLVIDGGCKPTTEHLDTAIWTGHFDIVKYLVVDCGCKPTTEHLDTVIQSGHFDIVKCLVVDGRCKPTTEHLDTAIQRGNFDIVKWLVVDGRCKPTTEQLHTAIRRGHFDIVKYLVVDGGCKPTTRNLYPAIWKGNFDIVKCLRLVVDGGCKPTTEQLDTAIRKGHFDIVKYLVVDGGCKPTIDHLGASIQWRHFDIVKWLVIDGGCKPTTGQLDTAILRGYFDIVKCLVVDGGCKPTTEQLDTAIQRGYFDIVKCLVVDGGCKPTTEQLDTAFQRGHFDIVKCLVVDGRCKPTTLQLYTAIQWGHFDIVKCLVVDGGCKPTNEHLDFAIQRRHFDIMKCLVVDGGSKPTTRHLNTAIQRGHFNIVKWLVVDGGCKPTNEHLDFAIQRRHFDIVKCLVVDGDCKPTSEHLNTVIQEHALGFAMMKSLVVDCGYKPTTEHLDTAVQTGNLVKVKLLVVEGGCKPTTKHLDTAIQRGYFDIVKWIVVDGGCKPTTEHLDTDIQRGRFDTMKCLVADGRCKLTTEHLDTAIQWGHLDIVKWLVVDGECKPTTEQLHTAIHTNAVELAHSLLDSKKIDLNSLVDPNQRNVLHVTCVSGQLGIAKLLIKDGRCNIGDKDREGNTALHLACHYDHYEIVKALLDPGKCDVNSRNMENTVAMDLSNNPNVIRELIKYGAHLPNVYKRFGNVLTNSPRQPIEAPVKVVVTGDPRGGKSTLTKSLQKEASALARVLSRRKVSDVDEKTAGIIPYQFESKQYGSVTFYDLAGQREFYSSHAAVLSSTICSSPPIFLLVIDLQKKDEELEQSIFYWLSFLENQCSSVNGKPHVIIIGSHADILKSRGENPKQKGSVVNTTVGQLGSTWFDFSGFIPMDCQYPHSSKIDGLRRQLSVSCKALRVTSTIQFNCHCLLVYLIDNFSNCPPVTLQQVKDKMLLVSDQNSPSNFVSLNIEVLLSMCEQLYDRGHILLLKNKIEVADSWIIIDKEPLLSEVTGTVFAPEGFKQHCKLASSTGVVPLSEIVTHFPKHNSDMLICFFTHLEYCREICDQETLELIEVHQSLRISTDPHRVGEVNSNGAQSSKSPMDRYFLFSGLITINRPNQVWITDSEFRFKYGWILQCPQPTQFFSSRFLQVLLLRIAFAFALSPHKQELDPSVPALQRKCSIWRNAIFWGNRIGVEVLVEVIEYKTVIVLMRSQHLTGGYIQLRSSIIRKVLKTATDLCPKVSTTESFINPSETLQYPIDSVSELTCFSISEVAASVSSAKTAVVTTTGKSLPLESLLTFEPYALLSPHIFWFERNNQIQEITDDFLMDISASCGMKGSHDLLGILEECLNVAESEQESKNPVHRCFLLLQTWKKKQKTLPTLLALRRVLDQHSVFGGRNPMELGDVGSSFSTHSDILCESGGNRQETDEGKVEQRVKEEEKLRWKEIAKEELKEKHMEVVHNKAPSRSADSDTKRQSLPEDDPLHSCSVQLGTFSKLFNLDDLGFLMESLCQAAPQWYYIGLQLGVHPTDLDNISHNISLLPDSPKSFLREMLKTWLSPQARSLPALLSAQ